MMETNTHSDEHPTGLVERKRKLIYDVGMHKGEDTDFYLKRGFKVIGFETSPNLVSHCNERFSKEIREGQLHIVEGAIVDLIGQRKGSSSIDFFKNESNSEWGTVNPDWARRNEKLGSPSLKVSVPVVDFRACLQTFGIPYYLKIDIEGMDYRMHRISALVQN